MSLLPNNATPSEQHLEASIERNIPVALNSLWDPQSCPQQMLPWLAWALSVDEWSANWSEEYQRAVIQSSYDVHLHKGTFHSIKKLLEQVGSNITLIEWFENGGDAHTFEVDMYAGWGEGDSIISPTVIDRLIRMLDATKPVRSHYTFRIGAAFSNKIRVASATRAGAAQRLYGDTVYQIPSLKNNLRAASICQPAQVIRAYSV